MYVEYLEALITYIKALNEACAQVDEKPGLSPYLGAIPVLLDASLVGWIIDDIGGSFSYRDSTEEEEEWWAQRPWNKERT